MIPPLKLESESLLLKRIHKTDAVEIFENYASKAEVLDYVSWKPHKNISDTYKFLKYADKAWEQGREFSYSIRRRNNDALLGSVGMINQSNSVSLGYIIAQPYWGNGYATEAVQIVLRWLKNQEEVFRIWALIDQENEASGRVLVKAGLRFEAIIKNWTQFVNQDNRAKDCAFYVLD